MEQYHEANIVFASVQFSQAFSLYEDEMIVDIFFKYF